MIVSPQPFHTLTAIAAPLLRDHIDTDAIIPSREIKTVTRTGLADGLFAGWRYRSAARREPDPQFVLNRADFHGARILLAGANFGCGSSREHAVWALQEYGFRVLVAVSFAPIFFDNCVNNGMLPVCVTRSVIEALAAHVLPAPGAMPLTVDLAAQTIGCAATGNVGFGIDADVRLRLLEGLDEIELSLRVITGLAAFYAQDRRERPWVYLEESA